MSTAPDQIVAELRTRLDLIDGLHVPPWGEKAGAFPAALIGFPEEIEFAQGARTNRWRVGDWPVVIVLGRAIERAGFLASAAYTTGTGPKSIKQTLDSTPVLPYQYADTVVVNGVTFDAAAMYAGKPAAALIFHVDITSK